MYAAPPPTPDPSPPLRGGRGATATAGCLKIESVAGWAKARCADPWPAIMAAFYSARLFTFLTHTRTSASTSGSAALTSATVMPALMRGW
jgi:hypothetical protein